MRTRSLAVAIALLSTSLPSVEAQQAPLKVPELLSHQGRISVGETAFDGTGLFKFSLVNATGGTIFWSNDGTTSGEPHTFVSLPVSKGLYSILLGDTSRHGMTRPIPASVFSGNEDVRLRIWFDDGENGFQLLSPDQRIVPAGYAMVAATVPDQSITQAKLVSSLPVPNGMKDFVVPGEHDFVVPEGITRIQVEAWGAGGGGWGGAGGYSRTVVPVTAGSTYKVAVGQGAPAASSNAGGSTEFRTGNGTVLVRSSGGQPYEGGNGDPTAMLARKGRAGGSSLSGNEDGLATSGTVDPPIIELPSSVTTVGFDDPIWRPAGSSAGPDSPEGVPASRGYPGYVLLTW